MCSHSPSLLETLTRRRFAGPSKPPPLVRLGTSLRRYRLRLRTTPFLLSASSRFSPSPFFFMSFSSARRSASRITLKVVPVPARRRAVSKSSVGDMPASQSVPITLLVNRGPLIAPPPPPLTMSSTSGASCSSISTVSSSECPLVSSLSLGSHSMVL